MYLRERLPPALARVEAEAHDARLERVARRLQIHSGHSEVVRTDPERVRTARVYGLVAHLLPQLRDRALADEAEFLLAQLGGGFQRVDAFDRVDGTCVVPVEARDANAALLRQLVPPGLPRDEPRRDELERRLRGLRRALVPSDAPGKYVGSLLPVDQRVAHSHLGDPAPLRVGVAEPVLFEPVALKVEGFQTRAGGDPARGPEEPPRGRNRGRDRGFSLSLGWRRKVLLGGGGGIIIIPASLRAHERFERLDRERAPARGEARGGARGVSGGGVLIALRVRGAGRARKRGVFARGGGRDDASGGTRRAGTRAAPRER